MSDGKHSPLIIAHRGASAYAPENTLASIRRAVAVGADGVEFDVRLSKDGIPIVIHDADLERTCGRTEKVSEMTAEQLVRIDAGSWFNVVHRKKADKAFEDQRIPTLAGILNELKDFDGVIYIELKCREADAERLAKAVCSVLAYVRPTGKVIVKSFRLAAIPVVRMLAPDVTTAALFAPKVMTMLRKEKYLVKLAESFGADELSLHYSLATRRLMEKAHEHGFPVAIWTADHLRLLKRAAKLGVSAIITNDPEKMLAATI